MEEISHDNSLCGQFAGVDGGERVRKSRRNTCLASTKKQSSCDGLPVVVGEAGSDGNTTPEYEGCGEGLVRTKAVDCKDPWGLEKDKSHEEDCVDGTELATVNPEVLVKAKNSSIRLNGVSS